MKQLLAMSSAALSAGLLSTAAAQTPLPVLGRLFTTPTERIELDHQRYSAPQALPGAAPAAAAPAAGGAVLPMGSAAAAAAESPPPAPPPAPVQLSGVVRRSDGSATIWLDNEARETRLRNYKPGGSVPVEVGGRRVLMKPGQTYSPDNGAIDDAR